MINMHIIFDLFTYAVLACGSEVWLQIQGTHAIRHSNRW